MYTLSSNNYFSQLQLLVNSKIISLDLPVKEVYKKIWCPQGEVKLFIDLLTYILFIYIYIYKRERRSYIGITANEFKQRYRNHLKSFRNAKYSNDTELSKHVWNLKKENKDFSIKWSIIKRVAAYKPGSKRCNLCLEEKLLLMKARKKHFLNKRSEFFSKCRHVTRHQLNLMT